LTCVASDAFIGLYREAPSCFSLSSPGLPCWAGLQSTSAAGSAATRLVRLEQTSSHILSALGRLEQQMQYGTAGGGASLDHTAAAVGGATSLGGAADAAGASDGQPQVMARLLDALDRLQAEEAEIRSRWFGQSEVAHQVRSLITEGSGLGWAGLGRAGQGRPGQGMISCHTCRHRAADRQVQRSLLVLLPAVKVIQGVDC